VKFSAIKKYRKNVKNIKRAGHWWLTPVILAPQEAEIKRMEVQSQPQANSL
jgi:hypothetical protein